VPGSAGVGAVLAHGRFTGLWSTVTAAGNRYTMRLTQNGDVVSGTYELESGGATGTIAGTIDQGSLSYRWNEGGSKGSGKFTLAADGKSFTGWWNSGEDPNTIGSSWNGTRK
jgi:hypothetical protein